LRGSGVKKINTLEDLEQYAKGCDFVQDLIPFKNEVGICWYPNEEKR
jgi:hypothetical protein